MPRVILYIFGGRKKNLELALPYYERILEENDNVTVELWDLARDPNDSRYMRSLPTSDRFKVRTDFYDGTGRASRGQNRVWAYYTRPEFADCVFIKTDDDNLFYQTDAFPDFVQAAIDNPDAVVSSLTINNGASTRHIPDLWMMFGQLNIPLLDVHTSAEYAEKSHRWFFDNWRELIDQEPKLVDNIDWCSINSLSYTFNVGCRISKLIGTRPPAVIAERHFTPRNIVGDEGAANMLERKIFTGFTVAHYAFGPQQGLPDEELREGYAKIARQYLSLNETHVQSNM